MNLLTKEKSGGNHMDVQQDFKVDKDIVTRLIYRIIMDEKKNLQFPYNQRTPDSKMAEKIYKNIVDEVSKE
jgi:ribosomal protein S7